MDNVYWICFHGVFDFAYLLKLVTGDFLLPRDEYSFREALSVYFPSIFDIKTMISDYPHLHGSLYSLCQKLGVQRQGIQHQAGSDSLVTAGAFFKIKNGYYATDEKLLEVENELFGIDDDEFDYEWYDPRYMSLDNIRRI